MATEAALAVEGAQKLMSWSSSASVQAAVLHQRRLVLVVGAAGRHELHRFAQRLGAAVVEVGSALGRVAQARWLEGGPIRSFSVTFIRPTSTSFSLRPWCRRPR